MCLFAVVLFPLFVWLLGIFFETSSLYFNLRGYLCLSFLDLFVGYFYVTDLLLLESDEISLVTCLVDGRGTGILVPST